MCSGESGGDEGRKGGRGEARRLEQPYILRVLLYVYSVCMYIVRMCGKCFFERVSANASGIRTSCLRIASSGGECCSRPDPFPSDCTVTRATSLSV